MGEAGKHGGFAWEVEGLGVLEVNDFSQSETGLPRLIFQGNQHSSHRSEKQFPPVEGGSRRFRRQSLNPERRFRDPEHRFRDPEMSFRGPEISSRVPKIRFPKPEYSFPPPENAFGGAKTRLRRAKIPLLSDLRLHRKQYSCRSKRAMEPCCPLFCDQRVGVAQKPTSAKRSFSDIERKADKSSSAYTMRASMGIISCPEMRKFCPCVSKTAR